MTTWLQGETASSKQQASEHWPGNCLHAWTWASVWHPSGYESRSPLSTPGGRTRRWYARWYTSGQVHIPPPSWVLRLETCKEKQRVDTGDSGPSVTQCLCQYLMVKVLSLSHSIQVFSRYLWRMTSISDCLTEGALFAQKRSTVCVMNIMLFEKETVHQEILNMWDMSATYLCC